VLRQSQAGKGFRGDHRLREKQRILIVDDDYLIAARLGASRPALDATSLLRLCMLAGARKEGLAYLARHL
jgi:hypothetical protein